MITHYCWNCLYKVWLLLVILHNYNSFFEVFIHLLNLTCRLSQWQLLLLFFLCMVYAFHFCFICLTIILTFGYFRYFFVRSLDYCCWLFILLLFFFSFFVGLFQLILQNVHPWYSSSEYTALGMQGYPGINSGFSTALFYCLFLSYHC